MTVVECVPNFSEGRDQAKIKQITDAIEAVSGVTLLDVDPGADTNRTVVTFIGEPEPVVEAAFAAVKTAAQVIDMRVHSGAHPRMGATDVCPFVPVEGATIEDCAELARRLGARVGSELGIPVYLYEAAASTPERTNLAVVRQGEYEGLCEKLNDPRWAPDFGPARMHPGAGALITGAREFLIAYNISLNTRDKSLATDIAFELREKGRVARSGSSPIYGRGEKIFYADSHFPCGNCEHIAQTFAAISKHTEQAHGYDLTQLLELNAVPLDALEGRSVYRAGRFRHVKGIGWFVDEYDRAQISVNLTDFRVTPPHVVLEATRELAAERGLVVTGSEIVGLVPFQALYEAGEFYLRRQGRSASAPVADVLETAVQSMGLRDVGDFDVTKRVLGLPKQVGPLANKKVVEFANEVSRDTPAPGGGSIAALCGALGAALAAMVAALAQPKAVGAKQELLDEAAVAAQGIKDELVSAIDADTDAFTAYLVARRLPQLTEAERATREQAMQAGLKHAIQVPLATARTSLEALRLCEQLARDGLLTSLSDGAVGAHAAFVGVRGGIWNAQINLADITDTDYVSQVRAECTELLAQAEHILSAIDQFVQEHLGV